jgi:hypothetical protein
VCKTKCPLVQVEWFEGYRVAGMNTGPEARDLFDSLKLLPGEWKLYCTNADNTTMPHREIKGPTEGEIEGCGDIMAVPQGRAL